MILLLDSRKVSAGRHLVRFHVGLFVLVINLLSIRQKQVTKKSRMAALKAVGDFAKRLKGTPIIDRYARRCALDRLP